MRFLTLTLFTTLSSFASARPRLPQKRQEVVYVTAEMTATVDQIVATAWETVTTNGLQATETPALLQEQVLVNEINVEYSYSSARTIFAVPTVVTITTTQTGTVVPYVANGVTVTPPATTTLTNTIDAQATPVGTALPSALTATLPLVSVLIAGATVTVSAQTFTYYAPVIGSAGTAVTVSELYSTTLIGPVASAEPVISNLASQAVLPTNAGALLQVAPAVQTISSTSVSQDQTTAVAASTSSSSIQSDPDSAVSTTVSSASSSTETTSTSTTVASVPSATSISLSSQPDFVTTVLSAMNSYRSLHSAPALTWDYTLSAAALTYAETCVFEHSEDPSFGETLAAGTSADPTFYIDLWYNEGASYDYSNPGFSDATGHFTQLVWASTTVVGCALSSGCAQYPNYMVCRYMEAGNVVGGTNNDQYFIANVLAL